MCFFFMVACVCRGFATSSCRNREDSWFKSLFVRKVDPRKDAHSTLLTKNEESNLYKIQCKLPLGSPHYNNNILTFSNETFFFSFKLLFQSITSSQSAWMHTTNSGECFVIWCCEPLVQRKLYHKWEEDQGLDTSCKNNPVYSRKMMYGLVWLLSSTNQTCSYLRWLEPMDFKHNTCSFKLNVMWTAGRTAFNYLASRLPQWGCVALHPRW